MTKRLVVLCAFAFLASACAGRFVGDPVSARIAENTEEPPLTSKALAARQLQTRRFETRDRQAMLRAAAAAAVLLDLGFTLDEADPSLGILEGMLLRT